MARGKLLYSNLQMGKPWYYCAIHIHYELCMGARRLLHNDAQASVSIVRGITILTTTNLQAGKFHPNSPKWDILLLHLVPA